MCVCVWSGHIVASFDIHTSKCEINIKKCVKVVHIVYHEFSMLKHIPFSLKVVSYLSEITQ